MKIDYRDNNLIVFLNKKNIGDIDFYNKYELQKYFRKLFLSFKNIYDLDLCGNYDINVYIDKYYGAILEIIDIGDDYFDYCDVIDMNIVISKYRNFLYRLDVLIDNVDCDIYCYDGYYYYEPQNIDFFKLGFFLENGEVIFGSDVCEIKKKGNKLISIVIDKIS